MTLNLYPVAMEPVFQTQKNAFQSSIVNTIQIYRYSATMVIVSVPKTSVQML